MKAPPQLNKLASKKPQNNNNEKTKNHLKNLMSL